MSSKILRFSIVLLILNACDRPECSNNNPIFNNNAPESIIYKMDLEKRIQTIGAENLRYWLKAYVENDSQEYLLVNVQNDSLCAIMKLTINSWNKLEDIRQKKGVGRRGAELDGLTFTVHKKNGDVDFVYEDLSWIID